MNNHFNFGVIIPTYNSKSFIIEALESIFRQTLLPSEVMISDDGSSDATAQIVRSLSSDAPVKVNFITNPRPSGISANYLNALRHLSPCDYVVVADHDDTWLPQRLQVFNDVFHSEPSATLACCDSLFTDRSLRLTGGSVRGGVRQSQELCLRHRQIGSFLSFLRGGLPCLAHTLAFPYWLKQVLLSKPPEIPSFYFEEWVTSVAACYGELVLIPEALTLYRRHSEQVTDSSREQQSIRLWSDALRNSTSQTLEQRLLKLSFCKEILLNLLSSSDSTAQPKQTTNFKLSALSKCCGYLKRRRIIYLPSSSFPLRLGVAMKLFFSLSHWRFASGARSFAKDLFFIASSLYGQAFMRGH